jgi:hypothetical protein
MEHRDTGKPAGRQFFSAAVGRSHSCPLEQFQEECDRVVRRFGETL